MRKVILLTAVLILITACSSPSTKIYTIQYPEHTLAPSKGGQSSIAIQVQSMRYLQQPYIAYRSSPYELTLSHTSKWDTSPDQTLAHVIEDALAATGSFKEVARFNIPPRGHYTLKLHLMRFERYDTGRGARGDLELDFTLTSPEGEELVRQSIKKQVQLKDNSFASLAMGLSQAASEAAEQVRNAVLDAIDR